jgi:hypothetical protein
VPAGRPGLVGVAAVVSCPGSSSREREVRAAAALAQGSHRRGLNPRVGDSICGVCMGECVFSQMSGVSKKRVVHAKNEPKGGPY